MYDMYQWDSPAEAADAARRHLAASPWPAVLARGDAAANPARRVAASRGPAVLARGDDPPEPPDSPEAPANSGYGRRFSTGPAGRARAGQAPGVRAVQVALDRRDNGGDSSAARDQ